MLKPGNSNIENWGHLMKNKKNYIITTASIMALLILSFATIASCKDVEDNNSDGDVDCDGPQCSGTSEYTSSISEHLTINSYDGPSTCIACHRSEARDMLDSLHMQWEGPTPDLNNTNGEDFGKANKGINSFCTYAMSSAGACFGCHVRADGNAPHKPGIHDVDCLMCHQDLYQRTFVQDPNNTITVTNVNGETKTYVFGKTDAEGNYISEPAYSKMPAGTTMVELARTVHKPTRTSCLRCHAKAGGGDWTKRGDMGLSTKNPTVRDTAPWILTPLGIMSGRPRLKTVHCAMTLKGRAGKICTKYMPRRWARTARGAIPPSQPAGLSRLRRVVFATTVIVAGLTKVPRISMRSMQSRNTAA
jgi:hypothetical protein